jgi:hypothetical protein
MIERDDATAEDIDTAMELGAGYRKSTCVPRDKLTGSYGCKNELKSEGVYKLINSHSNSLISSD